MRHPQVLQLTFFKYSLKVNIDGPTEPQNFQKLLLLVSIRELHNSLVSDTEYGGIKEARDA